MPLRGSVPAWVGIALGDSLALARLLFIWIGQPPISTRRNKRRV